MAKGEGIGGGKIKIGYGKKRGEIKVRWIQCEGEIKMGWNQGEAISWSESKVGMKLN